MVGLEEELMLLDRDGFGLANRAPQVIELLDGDTRFKLELPASQLETVVPPQALVQDAAGSLVGARSALAAATEKIVRLAAAGAHPFSPGIGEVNSAERYTQIALEYGCVARRELICALHVHVAVRDADRALAIYNAVRSYLPQIAALAANAPCYEGKDTGFASVRPLIATLLPRQGVPPAFENFSAYAQALEWGSASDAFPDPTMWWWELRLNGRVGTLEFRVPDAQTTVGQAAALAAVIQALVAWLSSRHDAGEQLPVHPTWMIDQNRWSACRHGLEGAMVDLDTGESRPTRARLEALLADIEPAALKLGSRTELAAAERMVRRNGALEQREVFSDGGAHGVAEWLAQRFLDPPDG
jgi:glutamate---cysteine ligase / carboxylate-amine ligase